jgi:UDP-N-acetylmuramoyl-tripeptide--D-alanyl-D-alanine ligase
MSTQPLWTLDAMAAAMRAERRGALPAAITGVSIDSRTLAPGEAYFAIKGDVHDGHAFVDAALKAGAALAVVEAAQRDNFAADARLLIVEDVLAALCDLARASRARLSAQGDRSDGLGRQDLDQGSVTECAGRAGQDPRLGGLVQ